MKKQLAGDDIAIGISATRAITIDAPIADVWKWIIQLGADRGGFFSYYLIEKALGYEMREIKSPPEPGEMEVGRIIPGSLDESKSLIKYNFPVVAVEPGKSFVLKGWGAFVLEEISPRQTRFIIRTHTLEAPDFLHKVSDSVGVVLHYIMERRMLLGFKTQIETGKPLSAAVDNLWLLGIFLSGIGIALLAFVGEGVQGIVAAATCGVLWLYTLLIPEPRPLFSVVLLLIIVLMMIWV